MLSELVERNEAFAARFGRRSLPIEPRLRLALLTCVDARIDPLAVFRLRLGDAQVVRNAGARATDDAKRSLAVSVHVLGVRTIAVMGHTGCGLIGRDDAFFQERVRAGSGADVRSWRFLSPPTIEAGVITDVCELRGSRVFAGLDIGGFVYDVETGRVRRVI
jgi:carbonic anhydrase